MVASTSAGSCSEILTIADLLDHAAHASVGLDGNEEVVGRHHARARAVRARMDLALERAPQDVGDVAAAHPAHEGQDLAVVDVAEERAARLALELRALEIEDLLLARGIGQRDPDEMIEASRRHERRIDDV